ncbi:inactive poly [ADP-ribose] polymerase RCD1-like isoform X2 [Diospyros lotus]|uniref:inactive poly [ADP-ribose] polymerase RCD1-like isoform X2 n=1 Tax=Diospyros lotus TaxID=55363 RepID=UPI00224FB3F8|nr:inactive poly [ADP-ribose] polymerase RCD1-like isoform X2 [Diospyros lotus]
MEESGWVNVLDNSGRIVVDSRRKRAAMQAANIIAARHKVLSLKHKHNSLFPKLGKRKRSSGCKSMCWVHMRKSLLTNYSNFTRSGPPKLLLFYQNGDWNNFPQEIIELVKESFQMKKAAIEVQSNGRHLMLDMLYMIQVDLKTGSQKPIAWIDEAGGCFFPQLYSTTNDECNQFGVQNVEPNETREIKLHLQIEVDGANAYNLEECVESSKDSAKRIKIHQKLRENDEELGVKASYNQKSDAKIEEEVEEVQQNDENLFTKFENNCEAVDLDSVRNMFLEGMKSLAVSILEIRRCSDNMKKARWEIFQKQVEVTRKYRGDPNVQYAWLASTKDALPGIMAYGLTNCETKIKGRYGIGIHLTSLNCVFTSANSCDVDENGVQYMIFCRVILGNMELVQPGSSQFHPSSENFDSGVNDLQNPSHYVVWNMNMNTHICPEYVISFKMSHAAKEALVGKESQLNVPGATACRGHQGQVQVDPSTVESVSFHILRGIAILIIILRTNMSKRPLTVVQVPPRLLNLLGCLLPCCLMPYPIK